MSASPGRNGSSRATGMSLRGRNRSSPSMTQFGHEETFATQIQISRKRSPVDRCAECNQRSKAGSTEVTTELEVVDRSVRNASSAAGVTSAESQRGLATPVEMRGVLRSPDMQQTTRGAGSSTP